MSAWVYLFLAVFTEVIGTTFLKLSNGFTHPVYTTACIVCFITALYLLSLCVQQLDISVVYAIWSAVGIALISIIGVVLFNEQFTLPKVFFITLIAIGVIGLQLVSKVSE